MYPAKSLPGLPVVLSCIVLCHLPRLSTSCTGVPTFHNTIITTIPVLTSNQCCPPASTSCLLLPFSTHCWPSKFLNDLQSTQSFLTPHPTSFSHHLWFQLHHPIICSSSPGFHQPEVLCSSLTPQDWWTQPLHALALVGSASLNSHNSIQLW